MMLAGLLNIPHTNDDWSWFSWQHRLSHDRIRQAVQAKYGYNLTDYQIDPMDPHSLSQFLQNNSQLHSDMNGTLQLPGIDLLDIDLTKDAQRDAWINYHYLEHYYAELKLGVGS
jgi:hypothetical protein